LATIHQVPTLQTDRESGQRSHSIGRTVTCNGCPQSKARFSRLLRHTAWKRRGIILASALHNFVTYLLT